MPKERVLNNIIITISVLIVLIGLYLDLINRSHLTLIQKGIFYFIPMILLLINMLIQIKLCADNVKKEQVKKQLLFIMFFIYLILLFTLLFSSSSFSYREVHELSFAERLKQINIIPFYEIITFLSNFINGTGNRMNIIMNIGGNLIAFAPMGFFIPLLFKDYIKTIKQFICFMIIFVLIIETIQFVSRTGVADIDDIILNTIGATIVYCLMNSKKAKHILEKYRFL